MTTKIIKVKPVVAIQSFSPEQLISQGIEKGIPVETMERLLAMRRELRAESAKEQFDGAMADFQSECPIIEKKKEGGKTKMGQVAYYYAPLDSIVAQTKGLIQKNGFSYAIQTITGIDKVKVTCIVKHRAGHSESSDVEVPLGGQTGVMSSSQVVASALTFAKRYAFCNAFGILTGDQDDDSNSTKRVVGISTEQIFNVIQKNDDVQVLVDTGNKIATSKKYSKEQKQEIALRIAARIRELQKGETRKVVVVQDEKKELSEDEKLYNAISESVK